MAEPTRPPEVILICGMLAPRQLPLRQGAGAAEPPTGAAEAGGDGGRAGPAAGGRAPQLFSEAERLLVEHFGPVALRSEVMGFDFTHYYDAEMGAPLARRFVAFAERVYPHRIVEAKRTTNALEQYLAREHRVGAAGSTADGTASDAPVPSQGCAKRHAAAPPLPRVVNLDPGYVEPSKLVLASMKPFAHRIYLGKGVWGDLTLLWRKGRWRALEWTFPDYASGRYDAFLTEVRQRVLSWGRDEGAARPGAGASEARAKRQAPPSPERDVERRADAAPGNHRPTGRAP